MIRAAASWFTASRMERLRRSASFTCRCSNSRRARKTRLIGEKEGDKGVPFPAAIAVVGPAGSEKLLVADNLSDDVLLLDAATGTIEKRFDLSESDAVPSTYPGCAGGFERRPAEPLSRCGMHRRLWNSI